MANNYQIINLTAENYQHYIEEMAAIEASTFAEAWSQEAYINDICNNPNAHYTAVVNDGTLIAYANYWLIADEGNINNVAVNPKFRGFGYGKILMQSLIADCQQKGGTAMTLEVRASNSTAIALYEKLGFKSHGIRPHYYADNGEDALIMWLNL